MSDDSTPRIFYDNTGLAFPSDVREMPLSQLPGVHDRYVAFGYHSLDRDHLISQVTDENGGEKTSKVEIRGDREMIMINVQSSVKSDKSLSFYVRPFKSPVVVE